jgi:putative FmdB family regulatory protein
MTYEYYCNCCGVQIAIKQSIKDDPLKSCPNCSQEALEKILSPVPSILKGTGWYKTDYKGK